MAVLSLVSCFINEASVMEIAPSVVNKSLARPITTLNEGMFLVSLASKEKVKEVCKLVTFKASTKDDSCTLKLASWSTKLGADS